MFKKTTLIILILINLSIFYSLFEKFSNKDKLVISFIDVGQGDSILISSPFGQNILLDGGPESNFRHSLDQLLPYWNKEIDLIILTHPDSDHLNGLIDILAWQYQNSLLILENPFSSKQYPKNWYLWQAMKKHKPIYSPTTNEKLQLGNNLSLIFFSPPEDPDNDNNNSLITKLVYKNFSALFTGDAEQQEGKTLLNSSLNLKSTLLKVSHHGSKNGTTPNFLKAVAPSLAVISAGKNNYYGHPHPELIKLLEENNIQIYRTDQNGTIEIKTDGKIVEIKTELKI